MSKQFNQQRIHAIQSRLIALSDNPHYVAERRALTDELSRRSAMQPGEYELPILQEGLTMKLSEKFPASTPPATPGVYLTTRAYSHIPFWRAFDGKNWFYGIAPRKNEGSPSYQVACKTGKVEKGLLNFEWQGLAEKPYGVVKLTREEMDRIHNP